MPRKPKPTAIKLWRERMGYTQREAAQNLGASLQGYQNWETGYNHQTGDKVPAPLRIRLACAALEHGLPPI